ncbi:SIS domain-containing protein [Kribbella sandramycini]|uniref:Putative phosphosugar-binding protein n=1 Tax=Kribbella sandramycini TaxID=60450 RepID=A0A7Y4L604_9ACTN|nr:SIS domain-containing protein [Kribbella sandramycini]MBB6566023.1 putative phosphosugar-binding protein [Kribbella sandramycini]NOL45024.1 SIS domain-containing protein [Kribbella sandramycini]
MDGAEEYLQAALKVAHRAAESQVGAIRVAAGLVVDAMTAGHTFWVFGTGHSHLIAEEVYGRAGGLADVRAILEPGLMLHEGLAKSSHLERLPGLADVLLRTHPIAAGDVVLIASNSGRNAVPVEFALGARARGASVIALTSMAHTSAVDSRVPSGQRLFETADVVLDNCGVPGDALITVPTTPEKTGATSTVVGALLAQALTVEIVTRLDTPNVLRSLNA